MPSSCKMTVLCRFESRVFSNHLVTVYLSTPVQPISEQMQNRVQGWEGGVAKTPSMGVARAIKSNLKVSRDLKMTFQVNSI